MWLATITFIRYDNFSVVKQEAPPFFLLISVGVTSVDTKSSNWEFPSTILLFSVGSSVVICLISVAIAFLSSSDAVWECLSNGTPLSVFF